MTAQTIDLTEEYRDIYQELVNVAMGRAADLLARLLDTYIILPVPRVNLLARTELAMTLAALDKNDRVSAVCQGFSGDSISGEALLLLTDATFPDLAHLLGSESTGSKGNELELLMDTANVLIGACLKGFAEQIDVEFAQSLPEVLGQHRRVEGLFDQPAIPWEQALAIEVTYRLENKESTFELLLLFTSESIQILNNKINFLLED